MLSAELEPTVPESDQPQTVTLDRSATGIGGCVIIRNELAVFCLQEIILRSVDFSDVTVHATKAEIGQREQCSHS